MSCPLERGEVLRAKPSFIAIVGVPVVVLAIGTAMVSQGFEDVSQKPTTVLQASSYDPSVTQEVARHYADLAKVGESEALKAKKLEAAKRAAAERAKARQARISRSRHASESKSGSSNPRVGKSSPRTSSSDGSSPEVGTPKGSAAWAASPRAVRLRNCESGNNYRTNTGNGYYGAYQMDMEFWRDHGGLKYASRPDLAGKAAQDAVAYHGYLQRGWTPWPHCGYV